MFSYGTTAKALPLRFVLEVLQSGALAGAILILLAPKLEP